jgi:hypothetical protein
MLDADLAVFARTATTSTATGGCFGRGCPTWNASSSRRLAEEQTAMDTLAHETLPLEFAGPGEPASTSSGAEP